MEKVKRPRPQLSCTPCRNRKLKCDRTTPCSQCVKGKRIDQCTIPSESGSDSLSVRPSKRSRQNSEEPSTTTTPLSTRSLLGTSPSRQAGTGPLSTIETNGQHESYIPNLLARVKALEDAVFVARHGQSTTENLTQRPRTLHDAQAAPLQSADETTGQSNRTSLNVDGARIRYQGGLHRFALIEQFEDVRDFIPKAIKDPQIAQAIKGLRNLQKSRFIKLDIHQRELFETQDDLQRRVLELLPSRDICQQLLELYFANWETIFRIVHVVRFRELFNKGWPINEPIRLDLPFMLQMLLMVAIGGQNFNYEPLLDPDFANNACAVVQGYLDTCSSRIRQDFSTLQLWTLLVLTRQVYLVPWPKLWLETGNLLRHAMAIGLHRDPLEAKSIPAYNCELRRRLFATILEFDIQASLTYGMPMGISESEISCPIPSCIPDEELQQNCTHLPAASSETAPTNVCLQHLLAKSRSLRMQAVKILASRGRDTPWVDLPELSSKCDALFYNPLAVIGHPQAGASQLPVGSLGVSLYQTHTWQLCSQIKQQEIASHGGKPDEADLVEYTVLAVLFLKLLVKMDKSMVGDHQTDVRTAIRHQLSMVLCKRTILHAAFILCSNYGDQSTSTTTLSNQGEYEILLHRVLVALVDCLPYGDAKDVLLLAITFTSASANARGVTDVQAGMTAELLKYIDYCKNKLENVPEIRRRPKTGFDDQSRDVFATTPDSISSTFTDDILGPVEDLTFADLGFGYMDEWQDTGSVFW